jgi:hypothetical protein
MIGSIGMEQLALETDISSRIDYFCRRHNVQGQIPIYYKVQASPKSVGFYVEIHPTKERKLQPEETWDPRDMDGLRF